MLSGIQSSEWGGRDGQRLCENPALKVTGFWEFTQEVNSLAPFASQSESA